MAGCSRWRAAGRDTLVAAVIACSLASCASPGRYVWVQDLPPSPPAPPSFTIEPGDLLDVRVYNEERLSGHARVRADGAITLAFLGDLGVAGKTPGEVSRELGLAYQKYLNAPTITVSVEEAHPITITVMGETLRPGVFTIARNSSVLQALALAGGLNEFADRDGIFVLRRTPPLRVRFSYHALMDNDPRSLDFKLIDGDVVTVE